MPVTNNYEKVNSSFERAVTKMQEDLQYLIDNDKVSSKFVAMQNLIIKNLIDYQQQTEKYISLLEMENVELSINRIKQFEKYKNTIVSFEALCIIHGIMDFHTWMKYGKNYLVKEAIKLHKENTITLPSELKERIDRLPQSERETLQTILFGNPNS